MANQANYLTVDELNFRKAVFEENMAFIDTLNQDQNSTAIFGPNQFADKTQAEQNQVKGAVPSFSTADPESFAKITVTQTPPASVDWSKSLKLTAVKN